MSTCRRRRSWPCCGWTSRSGAGPSERGVTISASATLPAATLYFATSNAGKLAEMMALFAASPFELRTFAGYVSPAEGDTSYADNAALKARALHAQLRAAGVHANVLADDSGLEVAALGGRPGVLTAEYGGIDASWTERRALLLQELMGAEAGVARRARFVCALHCIDADGHDTTAFGAVEGQIALREEGDRGFSFDPVFWYPPLAKTFAELSSQEKNRISHRAIAVDRLLGRLRTGPPSQTGQQRG